MQYWLLKSEPNVWSIDQQKKAGEKGAPWDGVRNYQAAKNLKTMKKGDQCFFYHSNIGKEIVGIVEVVKEHYIDKTDKSGKFVAVTVIPQGESKGDTAGKPDLGAEFEVLNPPPPPPPTVPSPPPATTR